MNPSPSLQPVQAVTLTVEIELGAPVAITWKHMVEDILHWWRDDFLVCSESLGMHLEPKIGGLLFEKGPAADTGFVWAQIIRFEPNRHLAFTTQIAPPWGGPAQSVVQIALSPAENDPQARTKLTLTDSLIGHLTDESLSNIDEGWRQLFGEGGLKSFVEAG